MRWRTTLITLGFLFVAGAAPALAAGHYLFAWAGDAAGKGQDFIAVIDADPASPAYGTLVTSAASGIKSMQAHHTEYWMPESGFLFANDHMAGKTVILDVRDALHPKVHATFGDLGGYSHPHSFLRLPNGHVLASYQVEGWMNHGVDAMAGMDRPDAGALPGVHGGIVEIDENGKMIRAASTADPSRPNDLLMAYSLMPLPAIDRVIVTNSSMRDEDRNGYTYQVFRLSDLKRLSTNDFDVPQASPYAAMNPEEARVGPDGSVYVQTVGCGIERITDIASVRPHARLVYQFPGSFCGVPSIVSHYLVQSVPILHAVVVLDLSRADSPREVSRVAFGGSMMPHWTGFDAKTNRLAVTGWQVNKRLYMLSFDPPTGAIAIDRAFHDAKGSPGFDFDDRTWPHGWTGSAYAHGVVFSR